MVTANMMTYTPIIAPIVVYIIHHPDCNEATQLTTQLFHWFRLGNFAGDAAAAGLPVYYRRALRDGNLQPDISWNEAELNVLIVLVDHRMVAEQAWREAIVQLVSTVEIRQKTSDPPQFLFLPVALHTSFYQLGPLYENFNPVRLLDLSEKQKLGMLRRAVTGAIAQNLLANEKNREDSTLNVFLSHAKQDGIHIAEYLRDSVRSFGQLVAWYDANDLPYGAPWGSPMEEAVERGTAAMIATVTDAYSTRPWCRHEATLARTPRNVIRTAGENTSTLSNVWTVQPVVAVHYPQSTWAHSVPMLAGVPRIGWTNHNKEEITALIVDRLILETLLVNAHRRLALTLDNLYEDPSICFITWVPDHWSLSALGQVLRLQDQHIRQIAYPGYGLRTIEIDELKMALAIFGENVQLTTYEELWP